MSHETELGSRYGAVMMNAFGTPRRIFARGEGIHLWDADGNRYVDDKAATASTDMIKEKEGHKN